MARTSDLSRVSDLSIQAAAGSPRKGLSGRRAAKTFSWMPRRTIIDDRLDGHIRRIGAGRKVQAVLCVEPLGDDGYAISIPA